jgi:hypothetical protein
LLFAGERRRLSRHESHPFAHVARRSGVVGRLAGLAQELLALRLLSAYLCGVGVELLLQGAPALALARHLD